MYVLPLISIIVPIYNVEPYIQKCLDSLKKQTLKEIEIILIDDGSTDNSGKIAEQYSKIDKRFIIIHTNNRGLSAARNLGVKMARANRIMFVDSDDWVDERFCERPYEIAVENNADIIVFQYYYISRNGRERKRKKNTVQCGALDHDTAMDVEGIIVWNKLYSTTLFEDFAFPEGTINEDILSTHKLIYKAKTIISISDRLYYYRYRKGSISHGNHNYNQPLEFVFQKQRYDDLIAYGYSPQKARKQIWGSALSYCGRIDSINDPLYSYAVDVVNTIEGIPSWFNWKKRIMLVVWRINHRLFRLVYKFTGRQKCTLATKGK